MDDRFQIDWDQITYVASLVCFGIGYGLVGATTVYFTFQDLPNRIEGVRHSRRCCCGIVLVLYGAAIFLAWPLTTLYNSIWMALYYLWAFALTHKKTAPGCILRNMKSILWHTAFSPKYCHRMISNAECSRGGPRWGPSVLPAWENARDTGVHTPPRR